MSGLMIEVLPGAGHALVVGGGTVAARKVRNLEASQFSVTVIAPVVLEEIRLAPHVTVFEREYREGDVELGVGFALVFACTDSREVNRAVGLAARGRGVPVLVADRQAESTFFTPAVLRDGDLAIAVSTGGASPTLARVIRERIVAALGPGWSGVLRTARAEREERLARGAHGEHQGRGEPPAELADD
ncbi:MAG TPA: bifunctional precorrin-2 dehydrogenase/sirohydrochlorin ferrochelatase, partial [Tepidiformaceae bacterium]|nr:bifunctional precorrin-2 dehydrogenase/sirohydrochlorin ferrochelatase [Tepidiformaceae bacterium]